MFEDLKVSTTTIVGNCDCLFDIDTVFNKINIEGDIIKLKCNDKEKTKDKEITCKTFYNQITIHFGDNVNIKLFNNGKFQISGVKNKEIAIEKLNYILTYISDIKGNILIEPIKYKGVFVYKNKIIKPYEDGYVCENLIKNNKILIDNTACEPFDLIDGLLIQKTHENKQKKLYDCFGRNIGKVIYHMIRKNKNLCIKNSIYKKIDDTKYDILKSEKYPLKIGELEVIIFNPLENISVDSQVKLYFSCCSKKPFITEIKEANTNYNIKIKLDKEEFIDREALCSLLEEKNIKFIYVPSKYPGVKLTLLDTKITVFRTGSILFSKKNQEVNIHDVLNMLKEFLQEEKILKRKEKIDNQQTDISIWDLL